MTKNKSDQKNADSGVEVDTNEDDSIYRHAGIVTFFTLLSRILGMTRDLVISHKFGAGGATDAWVQAFRIPNALRRLTAEGSMTIAFVPIYTEVKIKAGPEEAVLFSRRVLGLVLAVTLVLSGAGMIWSETLTAVFSPGFLNNPEKFSLTATLIRMTFPYLVMVSLVAWAMGILNSEGRFASPAAAPIFLNLGIIGGILFFSGVLERPILSVGLGVLAGGLAQVFLQIPSLSKVGVFFIPRFDWNNPYLKRLFALLLPSLFGVAVYEINIIILGIIASYLPSGQIFHYHNATRLTELVMGLFAFAFTTAGLPKLSEHQAKGNMELMSGTVRTTFAAVMFTIFPSMAGLIAAAQGIVSMLYFHGAYTYPDVLSTAQTLQILALGMPAVAAVRVMVPVFYALSDARTPVMVSAITLIFTGSTGWWLSGMYQVFGLAMALSAGTWVQCLLLGLLLQKKKSKGQWFPWKAVFIQGVVACTGGGVAYWFFSFGKWEEAGGQIINYLILIFGVLGTAVFYGTITLSLGDTQAKNWLRLISRKKL